MSGTSVAPDARPCGSGDEDGMGWGCREVGWGGGGTSEPGDPWAVGVE